MLASRTALVVGSFLLIRWAINRWTALEEEGRRNFTTAELLLGWPGVWSIVALVAAGCAFAVAMRLPLARGYRWSIAAWSIVPLALSLHVFLYFRALEVDWIRDSELVQRILFVDSVYFFDQWAARAVFAALAGVALGAAIGHAPEEGPRQPPDDGSPLRTARPSVTAATET
jgi:hypothetical protein